MPMPSILGSYGNASIDRWDAAFLAASDAVFRQRSVRVYPRVLKAQMEIESGGDGTYPPTRCRACDGHDCVPACGPMQIKQAYHQQRCPSCDFRTVPGQIELAAHIIGMTMRERGGDEYDAITAVYFPSNDPNGTTQRAYLARVRELVGIMEADAAGPAPEPAPVDPIAIIVGRAQYSADYGYKSPTSLPYYDYFEGHGGNANQHTGIDVPGYLGESLATPADGVVTCAGTGNGPGSWQTGCAAFSAPDSGGVGRVEIMLDAGVSLILGHCQQVYVRPGHRVRAGQHVASMGSMNGPHVHIETRIWSGDDYLITDPRPTLIAAMGGEIPDPQPVYAERIPIPQPGEFDDFWPVAAVEAGVPVLQHTAPASPEVRWPLEAGEVFEPVYLTIGTESGLPYWISNTGSRVPMAGTRTDDTRLLGALYEFLAASGAITPAEPAPCDCTALREEVLDAEADMQILREQALDAMEEARLAVDERIRQAITEIGEA